MEYLKYLTKNETRDAKQKFNNIMQKIIQEMKDNFSLSYTLVGSSKKNLVLISSEKTFDLDYQIIIHKFKNVKKEDKNIKNIFIKKFENHFKEWKVKNSTTAITLKNSSHKYSFDVVICTNSKKGEFEILRKENNNYVWNILKEYKNHRENLKLIKEKKLWNNVRKTYKDKKNTIKDKKSYLLFMETVKETIDLNQN